MSKDTTIPTPKAINLHRKSRLLVVEFSDGNVYDLPCEYLRVFSPATEVRHADIPVTGKEEVNIEQIEPQGQYAVKLVFDDGYDSGIYSWETLHDLGQNREQNWQQYLDRLEQSGISRSTGPGETSGPRKIKLLYFNYLVKSMGKEFDELELPDTVNDVRSLLDWLRKRLHSKAYLLQDDLLRVTVNKQFAEPFTRIDHLDEIALVPSSPYEPAAPNAKQRQ
jgi:DUF971 family protein/molybdopterin converting factor small subunit